MDNAKHYDDAAIALIESRCKSNTHRINELQEHQTALDRLATSEYTDVIDIEQLNDNFRKLDQVVSEVAEKTEADAIVWGEF